MAIIECHSAQFGVGSVLVQVAGITDAEVAVARHTLDTLLETEPQVSDAVAKGFAAATKLCPRANPSDLWQHVVYRHLLAQGWSDNRWKRVSGFALERALALIYRPRLAQYGLRMRILSSNHATAFLSRFGGGVPSTKVDLFLEGRLLGHWQIYGAAHVKASIAERIQDDVPASEAFMSAGLLSIALTMDAKSYPPPHGDCINYGELGGRSVGVDKHRLKRHYVEASGQFDALFSFNLRTPPSPRVTPSGKRIHTLSLSESQPDELVRFLLERWERYVESRT